MQASSRRLAFKIAGLYAVFGAGWILLSDRILALLPVDAAQLTVLQSYKGVAFVVVTTFLLVAVLRRVISRWENEIEERMASAEKVRQLSQEADRLRTALNEHAIVAITDPRGKITYVNDKFCAISKYPRQELLGKDHRIINSGYHSKAFMRDMWETIAAGHTWQGEIRNEAKDGSYYWVNTTIVPFLNGAGRPAQYISIRTDITKRKQAEEALGDSERRLREMLENVDLLAKMLDTGGKVTFANDCLLRVTGWDREDALGADWCRGFVAPTAAEEVRLNIAEAMASGRVPKQLEYPIVSRTGESRDIAWSIVAMRDAAGRVIGTASIGADVTDRNKEDKARRLFRALVDQSDDVIEIIDPDTGRYIDISENGPARLGLPREEVLQCRLFDIEETIAESDWAQLMARMRADGGLRREGRHRRRNGPSFPVEVNAKLVRLERDYVLAIVRDISERKAAQAELDSERLLLRTLFDLLPDYLYIKDAESRFVACNEQCFRGMGAKSAEDMIGRTDADFYPAEVAATFRADELAVLAGKPLLNKEESFVSADGKRRYFLSTKLPRRDPAGRIIGIVGTGHEITERKLLEEKFLRVQRLEAIGTLAGGVAHDLNNILAPMLMAAGLLKDKLTDEHDREILAMMERGAQRGASVIGQLLTFSRGIAGARVSVQLRHLAKEMLQLMAETFPRNIQIELHAPPDLWSVVADATQLHQVLLNLCVNARDAMPTGGKLSLNLGNMQIPAGDPRLPPGAEPGAYVVLVVADTGHGIPPQIIDRIFDPFFTTKGEGRGTGLGLSTVLGIVKSHGGFLTVNSEGRAGTTFRVHLPASPGGAPVEAQAPADTAVRGHNELILVVDDEKMISDLITRALTRNGFRVISAENGSEAIKLFIQQQGAVRLVLTDMMMPVMGGIELIQSLRVLKPDLKIIALSGLEAGGRHGSLAHLGVAEVVGKPFAAGDLMKAVERVMAGETTHDAAT
ncbi:MAG TPA: PAS domain S-box protein [Lacunisphaera sp.]|jgi:PAS domain S-box-containing protein|nr:PAS domain S-box protein [Lacunisphaera sp.]